MAGKKRRKFNRNVNKNERETWSALPKDVLLFILSQLTLKESACASAVCNNWFIVVNSERVLNKPPLLLRSPDIGDTFELYDPSTRKTSYIELPQLSNCWICAASIDSWLLVSQYNQQRVFFFNPYNQDSIELPSFNLCRHKVALTSSPVSNDCTVFAVKDVSKTVVSISRCNLKTMKWVTEEYPSPEAKLSTSWITISNGLLYFKSYRTLMIFDTRICEWTLDIVPSPRLHRLPGVNKWIEYIVKHREDIFFIYSSCIEEPLIFKLNQTNKKWEKTKNLGGIIFFVGSSSVQARVNVLGMKSNNIYFPHVRFYGQHCIQYSVDEGRYYPNKKYYLPGGKEPSMCTWIDPP